MGFMLRLVFLGIVAWIIFRLVQRALGLPAPSSRHEEKPASSPQAMRPCAYCKVHIPENESTQSRGHFFCSEAHRDAFFRGQR